MHLKKLYGQHNKLGYAEADPSADIMGTDSLNKIRLSGVVAFDRWIEFESIQCEGIAYLQAEGYFSSFKTWVIISDCLRPCVEVRMVSSLCRTSAFSMWKMRRRHILANHNIAWFVDSMGERQALIGQGAGGLPTAGNILRDLMQIKEKTGGMLPEEHTKLVANNTKAIHPYLIRSSKALKIEAIKL